MSFLRLHKLVAYLLSAMGLFALTLGYELSLPVVSLGALAYGLSAFSEGPRLHRPGYIRGWNIGLFAFLLVQVVRGILIEPTLALGLEFAVALQVSRLFNRRTAMEYQQIAVLAFLHLIAATVLSTEISYALVFVGFVVVTPWMLVLSHLRREMESNYPDAPALPVVDQDRVSSELPARASGEKSALARVLASKRVVSGRYLGSIALLSLPLFLMTVAIFVMVPRVGQGFLNFSRKSGEQVAGFGDKVELGGFGVIRDDPAVVVRVQPLPVIENRPPRLSLRLRGTSFDHYDGRRWSRSLHHKQPLRASHGGQFHLSRRPKAGDQRLRIVLDALDQPVVFVPHGSVALRIDPKFVAARRVRPKLSVGAGMDIRYPQSENSGLIYDVFVGRREHMDGVVPGFEEELSAYVQVPAGHEKIAVLARQVTAGEQSATAKAAAVLKYLHSDAFAYSLEQPAVAEDEMPLDVFLFRAQKGHCEYFSSAMAIMLRTVGVATRNVTGFLGGRYNEFGDYYALRQGDAHSWVEVYSAKKGWVMFDPTPSGAENFAAGQGLLSGFYAVMDAIQVKWMTSVVGYDLRTQMGMLRDLRDWMKSNSGTVEAVASKPGADDPALKRRAKMIGLAILLFSVVIAVGWLARRMWWRRRHLPGSAEETARAVRLYIDLEKALAKSGRHRPVHCTPLEYAAALRSDGFSEVDVVDEVTKTYLDVRFGNQALTDARQDELQRAIGKVSEFARR